MIFLTIPFEYVEYFDHCESRVFEVFNDALRYAKQEKLCILVIHHTQLLEGMEYNTLVHYMKVEGVDIYYYDTRGFDESELIVKMLQLNF